MSSPIAFIHRFRQDLHAAGIRFAITSGQACVYFESEEELDLAVPPLEELLP